jgi:uncharacterized protein (TIGR02217 family)
MAYIDLTLDPQVARGGTRRKKTRTLVITMPNGVEQRIQQSAAPQLEWDLAYALKTPTEIAAIVAHWDAVGGQANTFRFKDVRDYTDGGAGTVVSGQMYKTYTVGGVTVTRKITKPKSGTITLTGGALGGTINYSAGTVSGAADGGWTGQFDCHVNFVGDSLDEDMADVGYGNLPQIGLLEKVEP